MTAGRFDVVLITAPGRRHEAEAAIALAGGRVIEALDWDRAGELTGRSLGRPVLALEAEGVEEAVLAASLPQVREVAEAAGLPVVATLTRGQIDVVAGALLGLEVQLLCEGGFGEWVGALALAGRSVGGDMAGHQWREGEKERLQRLNDEIARIAELLARLVDRERGGGPPPPADDGVDDRRMAFGVEAPIEAVDPQAVRHAIRGRRMRDAFFGRGLFEDPAWDMLLDLYAAHLEGARVSVSSLCIAAAVAPTTALRWIGKLSDHGLLERHPDPADRRRAFLALSPRALDGMNGYIAATRRAGLPIG